MAYRITLLPPAKAPAFASMTFPAYRPLLGGPGVAFAAVMDGAPAGLALFGTEPGGAAQLLSLYVDPPHRGNGLATALLGYAETILDKHGIAALNTTWSDSMPGSGPFSRVLAKRQWSEPQRRMLVLRADMPGRFGPWLRVNGARYEGEDSLPRGYALRPWADMTPDDRGFIASRLGLPGWHAPDADPFREERLLDPALSRLLLKDGDIVGWLTVHRTAPDTARFTDVFLREDLRRAGAVAVAMVIHGFWLLLNAGVARMTWAIRRDNAPLLAMCQRRLADAAELHWTRGAGKILERMTPAQ